MYAMDALFGLPRKKSVGVSYREPLHGDLFFSYQSTVDQYVAEYNQSKDDLNVKFAIKLLFVLLECINLFIGME